jgi:hypothetical protein
MLRLRRSRFPLYLAAAALLVLAAGCGWTTGATFQGDYNPDENTPITAVQKWFASMEWLKTENDQGELVRDPDKGRDFNLFLEVVDPDFFTDPSTGQLIGQEELNSFRELWQSKEWEVEFYNVQLEEVYRQDGEAKVKLVSGNVRYIGDIMFKTKEYKMDDFKTKQGEIYLRWYDDPTGDPLLTFYPEKAVPRWVITGGLDLGENTAFGYTQ